MNAADVFAGELHAARHPEADSGSCISCFLDVQLALDVLPEFADVLERNRKLARAFDALCIANQVLRTKLEKAGVRL